MKRFLVLNNMDIEIIPKGDETKKVGVVMFLADLLLNGVMISLILMLYFPPIKSLLAGIGIYYVYQMILDDIRGR